MRFRPIVLRHQERVDWTQITHVRLKSLKADTNPCQLIVDHIAARCDDRRLATLEDVLDEFPPVRKELDRRVASLQDLRHMANLRESGDRPENKGLIEIGILEEDSSVFEFPNEASADLLWEGARSSTTVNKYERDPKARKICLDHWGLDCSVCGFNFEKIYGGRGVDFIHVHHTRPISEIGESYVIDPINDLIPVCPNCHAMIHRFNPPATVDDIKRLIVDGRNAQPNKRIESDT